MNFSLTYPAWFIILCLVAGVLFSFLLYRKQKKNYPNQALFYLVSALRFLTVSTLAFLLLSPILRYLQNKEEKPTLVFLQDNSASEKFAFKKIDSVAYRNNVSTLLNELKKEYRVKEYSLGSNLHDSLLFTYDENGTDISTSLEMLMTTLENVNLSGIILASDGVYNQGMSPLNINYPFKGSIYTIGLGDTTIQRDAFVSRVFANKIIYLGDQFVIRSDVSAYSCKSTNFTVSVFSHNANRVVSTQTFSANDDRFSKSIETILDAKTAGVQHFTISISKVDGELNTSNNSQDVYVEVLDNKENILIVANAPHPDIFALKEALTKNKNYKVDIRTADKMNANVSDYNLIILHNLPSVNYNGNSIIDQAKTSGISIWYIAGLQTAVPLLNKVQTCVQINSRGAMGNEVQATMNKDFTFFNINPNSNLKSLPPISMPFGDYNAGPSTQTLLTQQVGNVNTTYPLWLMQQGNKGKTGVLAGEGIWRWRLYDYNQHKNHDLVDEFILKTAQYLAVKLDKRQFRTILSKSVFNEHETIVVDAELYNENFELINTPDVTLDIVDENNKKYTYTMNKENNSYSINIGNMAAGNYNYIAKTAFNGKSQTANGNFKVTAQDIELVNTTADFGLLNQLAKNTNGEMVYANDILSLKDKIKQNPAIKTLIRTSVNTEPLINWKWLFAALILFLSTEWFIRKHSGNY